MPHILLDEKLLGMTASELSFARVLVDEIVDCEREIAALEARKAIATAELARIAQEQGERADSVHGPEYARRAMAAEVAAATHVHPASAQASMSDAEKLVEEFPSTLEALEAGQISRRHADVVVEAGRTVAGDDRATFDAAAAELAQNRTPGDVKRLAKVVAERLTPTPLLERHRQARTERRVVVTDRDDGMSELWAWLPTLEARAVKERLTEMAKVVTRDRTRARAALRAQRGARAPHGAAGDDTAGNEAAGGDATWSDATRSDAANPPSADTTSDGASADAVFATDERTRDQLRADLLADLLLTSAPTGHELHAAGSSATLGAVRATVQVTIPASTMIDAENGAAWIDEGGIVSPESARTLAGDAAGWERLFVRPSGEILATDRYRPTAAQRRRLIGRDVTCRFPGCTVAARRADIDHTRDFARGGRTEVSNLSALCESHHVMKHHSGWSVRQIDGGVLEWTSPTGRVHRDEPPSTVFFEERPRAEATRDAAVGRRASVEQARPGAEPEEISTEQQGPAFAQTRSGAAREAHEVRQAARVADRRTRLTERAPLVTTRALRDSERAPLDTEQALRDAERASFDTDRARLDAERDAFAGASPVVADEQPPIYLVDDLPARRRRDFELADASLDPHMHLVA
ncbi:HNH endonuclease signature motif containing protein [Microbacterium sp. G2-8]|uniref:HNH endonuclease signature motif containing protein n=1 Tax=Microbacterium sp. G2-8 TaxID=2842454 RepID=UPI001C8A2C84|nr:HNH endonuclease signature motif containing protein [Microbacterium sp. G2-8]